MCLYFEELNYIKSREDKWPFNKASEMEMWW